MGSNAKPTFSLESIPQFMVGTFQSVDLEPSDGTPPYKCSVSEGDLPKGLAFSAAGVLSGTATTPNDISPPTVWFMVEDSYGEQGTTAYTVPVAASNDR